MTDPKAQNARESSESSELLDEEIPEGALDDAQDAPFKALLKRSLKAEGEEALAIPPDLGPKREPPLDKDKADKDKELLAAVQRKLRKRSKGKFYGDGWSTSNARFNYALIAGVMLVTIVAVYLALGPTGVSLR